jgi:hypothetical protein
VAKQWNLIVQISLNYFNIMAIIKTATNLTVDVISNYNLNVGGVLEKVSANHNMEATDGNLSLISNKKIVSQGYKSDMDLLQPPADKIAAKKKKDVCVFYIGGAGDKRPYLGQGPNGNIVVVQNKFYSRITSAGLNRNYEQYYLGFDDINSGTKIKANVTNNIPSKSTPIYIVGHSLGGWSGAHLSRIISEQGYKVMMLITLDPVGKRLVVGENSGLYRKDPHVVAKSWINIYVKPKNKNFSDLVAEEGGRWVPEYPAASRIPDIFQTTGISHAYAHEMFVEKWSNGLSASDYLLSNIANTIDS